MRTNTLLAILWSSVRTLLYHTPNDVMHKTAT